MTFLKWNQLQFFCACPHLCVATKQNFSSVKNFSQAFLVWHNHLCIGSLIFRTFSNLLIREHLRVHVVVGKRERKVRQLSTSKQILFKNKVWLWYSVWFACNLTMWFSLQTKSPFYTSIKLLRSSYRTSSKC